jgi:excisionase family DNA binding protein
MEKTASDLLTVHAAAEALSVSERTVRSWISSGLVPVVQPAGEHGAIRIDKAELLRSERRSEGER